ncbi:2-phosphosulfolactate phosphatase [Syntrophobotulus glycolicus DSM 8271]|uniref:Probable 2-phosphosulfolactate phosphatase n=1 Tax=Syntrophobotulus glycolicus (strain DSM 8271 / FlGlyR) TaxID=645991 RepID=F0T021_SYNGF|nr:2-phosphosulfolactate phosphatase [Syntrophobotulus glycolicus]ADY55032.1 2-phosphosulfolactate phosphatase [Syntrophobotulus glycolicus DSM 8271]
MYIEVIPSAQSHYQGSLENKIAIVIDVFRATSTMATALANGAAALIPAASVEEALARKRENPEALLGGERQAVLIEGFDLGNSPDEYTVEKVKGKKVIITTTNGTMAIKAAAPAEKVRMLSFLNMDSVVRKVDQEIRECPGIDGIIIVCSGTEERFDLPDTLCAGMFIEQFGRGINVNDLGLAAQMLYNSSKPNLLETLKNTEHGQVLITLGFQKDVEYCSAVNRLSVVPVLRNGEIVWREDR